MSEQQPVIGQDGAPVQANANDDANDDTSADTIDQASTDPSSLVQQPAKVMRIGSMIKQLLEEVKSAPLDEAARARLSEIYSQSIAELKAGLAPELVDELQRLSPPFTEEAAPSEAELRIAQAQLVGWLEGLFHGIQAAVFAQQMAAKAQLEQMRGQPQLMAGGQPGAAAPFAGRLTRAARRRRALPLIQGHTRG